MRVDKEWEFVKDKFILNVENEFVKMKIFIFENNKKIIFFLCLLNIK